MTTQNKHSVRTSVESLESREMPSVSWIGTSGSNLYVYTDNTATAVTINSAGSGVSVVEGSSGRTWTYSGVSWVGVYGGGGNDRFVNNVNSLPVTFYGYGGEDYLEGYNGADYFNGGDGNDILVGYGGNDTLYGGNGRDKLLGMTGNDYLSGHGGDDTVVGGDGDDNLFGDDGNDQVIGGAGSDHLYGGNGDDTLVTIDGALYESADGGAGRDTLWTDKINGGQWWTTDWGYGIETQQEVTGFANGADRTLNGDAIADPMADTNYKNFRNNFLFSDRGPTIDDIDQGNIGDCWMLAALGAAVNDNAYVGREMVADFGDGTYGVRLGNSFYRVDADLPTVSPGDSRLQYAGRGQQDSLWVAIVEKAYASYRTTQRNLFFSTYGALNGGDPVDAFRAFNLSSVSESHYAKGSNSATVANDLYNRWCWVNHSATITTGAVPVGSPLVGNHSYSVTWIDQDANGNVTRIYLRNPWGNTLLDGTPFNPYFSITPAELAACEVWLGSGISS